MKATRASLSALLVFALLASPSVLAEDPGWHYGSVVGIHTNGLSPLRIRLDPSTREKCGGESDYVGVNHPSLAGDAYRAHQQNALHLLAAAMRQRARVAVHLAEQYDDGGAMYCLATAVRAHPPPTNDGSDDDGGSSSSGGNDDGGNDDSCSIVRNNGGAVARGYGDPVSVALARSTCNDGSLHGVSWAIRLTPEDAEREVLELCAGSCSVVFRATQRQQFCFAYAESANDARHWGAAVSARYELGEDAAERRQSAVDDAIASCEAKSDFDCSVHRTNVGCTYNP